MDQPKKELLSIENFLEIYDISRSEYFSQVRKNRLNITKLGRRTYIKRTDAESWLSKLGTEIVALVSASSCGLLQH